MKGHEAFCTLTLHEWYWLLIGQDRREIVELGRLRLLLTFIYNKDTDRKHQKKPFEIIPLPCDADQIKAAKLTQEAIAKRINNGNTRN